jgi:hypothetical protein
MMGLGRNASPEVFDELEMVNIQERLEQMAENTELRDQGQIQSAFCDANNKKWMKTFTFLDP